MRLSAQKDHKIAQKDYENVVTEINVLKTAYNKLNKEKLAKEKEMKTSKKNPNEQKKALAKKETKLVEEKDYVDYDNITDDNWTDMSDNEDIQVIEQARLLSKMKNNRLSRTTPSSEAIRKQKSESDKPTKNSFSCNVCSCRASCMDRLTKHKHMKHESSTFTCNQCEYTASDKNTLSKHKLIAMNHEHDGVQAKSFVQFQDNDRSDSFKCSDCNFTGTSASNLKTHVIIHQPPISRINCELCDFTANNKTIMEKHMAVALGHKRSIPCRYFTQGWCRDNNNCRFLHPTNQPTMKPHTPKVRQNIYQSNQQCPYYDQCRYFPSCYRAHNEICRYQERCFQGRNCRLIHLNDSSPNQHFLGQNLLKRRMTTLRKM